MERSGRTHSLVTFNSLGARTEIRPEVGKVREVVHEELQDQRSMLVRTICRAFTPTNFHEPMGSIIM